MSVALVTDSTACLPSHEIAEAGAPVFVVPLGVTVDGTAFVEGVDIDGIDVAQAQQNGLAVTTSRPAPATFVAAYQSAHAAGAEAIVSVHCSSDLSSTVSSAHLAAVESPVPVTVVDARTLGMAMGFAVLAGARCAAVGGTPEEVAAVVRRVADTSVTTFYVDSLDPLRQGGRIGRASALLGSALSIKPLLTIQDGQIAPLERVRTTSRAMGRLARHTLDAVAGGDSGSAGGRAVVAVHSLTRADLAEQVSEELRAALPPESKLIPAPLGAVVTAHVGGGTVATVVAFPPES